jgi:threonine efflux protein
MDSLLLIQFALTMLAAQFSPGPDMLLLVQSSVQHSLRAGLWIVLGIVCGLAIHCTLAGLGLTALLQGHPWFFRSMMLLGGMYLGWLALKLLSSLRQRPTATAETNPTSNSLSDRAAFLRGFITNLTNVKAMLFLASFLAAGLRDDSSTERKTILIAIILVQALVGWSLFVWLLQRPAIRSWYQRAERFLNATFGILLLLIALQLLFTAWHGHEPENSPHTSMLGSCRNRICLSDFLYGPPRG